MNDKIYYKDVLARITIDITEPDPFNANWIYRSGASANSSVRNFLQSRGNALSSVGGKSVV